MDLREEFKDLMYILKKKKINYKEFNQLIGNYFVKDYEEIEDNYYIINIICEPNYVDNHLYRYYTDYVELVN